MITSRQVGFFSLLIILFTTGCGTTSVAKGLSYSSAPKPITDTSKSTIYVYRTDTHSGYASAKVLYINGKKLINLGHGDYTWVQVNPGAQEIKIEVPWLKRPIGEKYSPLILPLETQAGKEYYVHLLIGVDVQGNKRGVEFVSGIPIATSTPIVDYHEKLFSEKKDTARKIISNYNYQGGSK